MVLPQEWKQGRDGKSKTGSECLVRHAFGRAAEHLGNSAFYFLCTEKSLDNYPERVSQWIFIAAGLLNLNESNMLLSTCWIKKFSISSASTVSLGRRKFTDRSASLGGWDERFRKMSGISQYSCHQKMVNFYKISNNITKYLCKVR